MWLKSDFSLDALKKVWIKIIPKVICQACRTCHGCHVQWRMWHLWYEYRVYNNVHISTTAVSMTTIRSRVVTYREGLLPIKSHDSFMTRSNEITWQTKHVSLYIHYHSVHQIWQNGELSWGAPSQKVTWHLDRVVLRNHVTN